MATLAVGGTAPAPTGSITPPRGTWQAWLPPDVPPPRLIDRAALVAELAEEHIPVSERTLRHWENRGVLPHPVRRQHEGVVRALYPEWMAEVVAAVAQLRAQLPLRGVIPLGRMVFMQHARMHAQPVRRSLPPDTAERPHLPPELTQALAAYLAAQGGGNMTISISLHDGGQSTAWVEALPPPPD